MPSSKQTRLSRRDSLKTVLLPTVFLSARWLLGCGERAEQLPSVDAGGEAQLPDPNQQDWPGHAVIEDAALPRQRGGHASRFDAGVDARAARPWARGGTDAMRGPYIDPFELETATPSCVSYPDQELGPCYVPAPTRKDISEGLAGLPMRLSFLVLRSDGCTPVAGAGVDIWHAAPEGYYSALALGSICNPRRNGKASAASESFCRGVQFSDQRGRCDFSSVFPGWYPSRTIHVHFTVWVDGQAALTSQLYFADELTDQILAQGDYGVRGPRDTSNLSDPLFSTQHTHREQLLFSTMKRADGSLHAWQKIVLAD